MEPEGSSLCLEEPTFYPLPGQMKQGHAHLPNFFKLLFNILIAIPMVTCCGLDGPVLNPGGGERFSSFFSPPDSYLVPRLGFCPLTGHTPGLLLVFSLDIIP